MSKKGCIVQIEHQRAIVMNTKGQFEEIAATSSMQIGQTICYGDSNAGKLIATLCLVLVMLSSVFMMDFVKTDHVPVSYVAVDINPGVEFTLNKKDEIISAMATNADGELVLAGMDLNDLTIQEAIESFVDEAYKLGYLDDERSDNAVLITIVNDDVDKANSLSEVLYSHINSYFLENQILGVVLGEETNEILRNEAMAYGLSAGKMRLIKQAVKVDPDLDETQAASMPVKDLNKVITENATSASTLSEEELLNEKENVIETVSMFRCARGFSEDGDVNFDEKLNDYQNNVDQGAAWDEVNKEISGEKDTTVINPPHKSEDEVATPNDCKSEDACKSEGEQKQSNQEKETVCEEDALQLEDDVDCEEADGTNDHPKKKTGEALEKKAESDEEEEHWNEAEDEAFSKQDEDSLVKEEVK